MHRIKLINLRKSPTRDELVTTERAHGELFLAKFPNLKWAGYIVTDGYMRLSANWIVPEEYVNDLKTYLGHYSLEGYELALFSPDKTPHGGQCIRRVI